MEFRSWDEPGELHQTFTYDELSRTYLVGKLYEAKESKESISKKPHDVANRKGVILVG